MRGNCLKGRRAWSRNVLALAVASCFAGEVAHANPTAPTVTRGQATFATQGNVLTVTNAPGTVINWQSFSIASQEITKFIQQSSASAVLNRVVGVNPSAILGQLQSNGRVFLINPNGIGIGPNATIDVAGFVASTLNISDGDFIAGRHRFAETPGAGAASVINQGKITTPAGGMVYLVGQNVENHGVIKTPGGEIMLAAGKSIELVDAQTPEVRVQITAPDGQALNLGQLIASGGRIGMYAGLVRHGGVANANTAVVGENGKIVFKAVKDVTLEKGSVTTASGPTAGSVKIEAQTGTATVAGTVEANATAARGGTIEVSAAQGVVIEPTARISATGVEGGRIALNSTNDAVRVSGHVSADASAGRGGQVAIAAATQASIAAGARVTASGTQGGGAVEIRATGSGTAPAASEATVEQGAVEVTGTIAVDGGEAQGGAIILNARSNAMLGDTGVLSAIGAGGGAVHVEARDGTTLVSGVVDASGKRGPGGKILLLAPRVGLVRNARLDVSGLTGGGIALVGGDFQGKNPDVWNAWRTYVGPDARIVADAIETGNGGKVIVWADDRTQYFGSISARGGANGGDGGFAEVSGKQFLTFDGRVDLGAARGKSGTLLLDPNNIIIANGGAATLAAAGDANTNNELAFAEGGGTGADQTISAAALTLIMNAGTSVELQAHTDITVNEAILPTGAGGLTLRAGDDVFVNQAITLVGAGALSIVAGDAGGTPTGPNADAGRNITIAVGGPITTVTGNVTLNAKDAVAVNGEINAGSGKILISANQNGAGAEGFSNSATLQTTSTAADAVTILVNAATGGTGDAAIGANISAGTGATGTITIDARNGAAVGGSITQSAGTLTAHAVSLTAGGGIGTAANPVMTATDSLTATNSTNNVDIVDADSVSVSGSNAGGEFNVTAGGAGSTLTVNASNIAAGSATLQADEMTLTGTVTGTNAVTLRPNTANTVVTLGNGAVGLNLSDATLDQITTTGVLTIGADASQAPVPAAGSITIDAPITAPAGWSRLSLRTGGAIIDGNAPAGPDLIVTHLALRAATGIGAGLGNPLETAVTHLAFTNSGAGGVSIANTGALTLTSADGITTSNGGSAATFITAGSPLTVAMDLIQAGAINLTANENPTPGAGDNLTVNTGVTVRSTGGNVSLSAGDNIVLSGTALVESTAGAGVATLLAGASNNDGATGGSISGAGTVGATSVLFDAFGAIGSAGNSIHTNAGTLAAQTSASATGGIFVTEADNLVIGTVSAVAGVTARNNGAIDIRTTAGDLTLTNNVRAENAVGAGGAGGVRLEAGGGAGNGLIAGAGRVTTGSGTVDLRGDAVGTLAAPILTDLGTGALTATSGAGDIAVSNNSAAGLNTTQLTGFTTGGGVQTIRVTQTAGDITVGGSVNVGADTLELVANTVAGQDILGAAGTLAAASLRLDASGGIGGGAAVRTATATATTGTLTLTSSAANAAGDIAVVEANALDTTRVALTTHGTAQSVSLTSTAGPITLGADIGTAADDLTLIATAGNIVGGAGAAIANNLTLNAAGGIGIGAAVNTDTAGNLALTSAGNGLLGDIAVVEASALNTNTVTINTHGSTQTVSLTAPSIAIGNAFGTANDNLTLVAATGSIAGAPTISGIDVVLDAATGIGTGTLPGQRVEVTATNLAARSRTTGGVFVSETNGVSLRTLAGGTVSNQAPNGFNYDLIVAGPLALEGAVSVNGTGNVLLTTTAGNITVNTGGATVGGPNNHVFLDSTGAMVYSTGSVTANTLALRSQAGGIGAAGTPLMVAAANLEAVATGGIFVSDTAGGLTIGGATLGGFAGVSTVSGTAAIAVTATNGALTITDQVVADGTGTVTLTTTGGGSNIALNAGGAVGSVDNHVFLDAGGAITQAAGSVTANTLALRSGAGDIGTSGTQFMVVTNNLEARATGGGAFVNDTAGGLTIGGAVLGGLTGVSTASVNGNIAVTATGGLLTVTDPVVAHNTGNVTLTTTGVNDIQLIAGAVGSATNHVFLDAGGTTTQGGGTVTANTLALRSGVGSIGASGIPFLVAASNLEARAPGGVFVRDTAGGLTLGGATLGGLAGVSTTAGNANIEVTATGGTLTITEQVVANGTGNVVLTTTGVNNIALDAGTVGSGANHVFLDAGGGITRTAGLVTADTLALRAGAGNIGTGVALLNVAANNVEAQAAGGGVFVNDTAGGVTIGGAMLGGLTGVSTTSVSGNIAVTATGGVLMVTDPVVANNTGGVTLTTTGANNIVLNAGGVVGSATNHVFLDAGGTTTLAGGTVTANTLALRSGAGSIGSVGTPFQVTANNLEAQATGGGVFIIDTAGGLTVGGATLGGLTGVSTTSGGASIAVTATNGSLMLTEAVTANGAGSVTLTATGGGSNVVLDANVTTAGTAQVDSPGTISGSGVLSAGTADLNAGTGIGFLSMAAGIVTADTGTGAIDLDNALAGPVTVSSLTTNAGAITFDQTGGGAVTFAGNVTTGNGGIMLTNANAGITIGAAGVVRKMAGAAPLAITATGASGTITNLGQISNNNTGTAVDLAADDMNLAAGTVTAGSGAVKLTSSTPGRSITIGAGGSGLGLSAADIDSVTTTGPLTIGDIAHTGTIATDGNVAFTSPSGAVTLQTSGGHITVGHQLEVANDFTLDTRGGGAGTGAIIGTAGGLLKVTGNNDLVLNAGAGIGSIAAPLNTDVVWTFGAPAGNAMNVVNSNTGDVVIRNSGDTRLAGNFRNQGAGELRLITVDGSIDTAAVNVASAGGRIALIANDTGTGGNITVGAGGVASNGGAVVLHAADNIVVNGSVFTSSGALRMMAGTSASGIDAGHATFGGTHPALAAETAADDDGSIFLNAVTDAGAGNIVLIAATTSAVVPPTSIGGVTQSASGALRTTGDLTVVTLRGTGGLDNGGASIILNAAPNNKAGTINVFACPIDGCPADGPGGLVNPATAPFATAPFINDLPKPALPPASGRFYADGAIVYAAEDGTNISGFGTVNDFTFFTPGSVTFSAVPLATRNLRIEATQDINISLTGPVQNADINGGRTGGSIQFIAGNDINYTPAAAGSTIGLPTASFNHDLNFIAAGDVLFNNAIYMGPSTLTVAANGIPILATAGMLLPPGVNPGDTVRGVLLNNNLLLPATGSGSVTMQGNHVVQTGGNVMLSGVNLTVQGGDLGSANQASNKIGQQLEVGGTLDVNLSGNFRILAAPSGGTSGNAAIVRADLVTATVGGELEIKGASATGGAPAGVVHEAGAAILQNTGEFKELTLNVTGLIKLTGGTPTAARTGAAAEMLSAGTMKIGTGGGLELTGGSGNIGLNGASQPAIPGIFQLLGSSTLFDVQGFSYPIDIDGPVRIFVNNALAPALLFSGAPPLNLDPLLAESLKGLDCAVFSGGACVIKFTAADAGDAAKGQGLGVCK